MTTTVTLTGTGVPYPAPGRAGAGVLIRYKDTVLQIDVGRGTSLRLAEAGVTTSALSAVLITHVHSDHLVGLPDLAMTRWVQGEIFPAAPLTVVVPEGATERLVRSMLTPYAEEIALRRSHVHRTPPQLSIRAFAAGKVPKTVWSGEEGRVAVEAVAVHHEPVTEAVAYRVRTPDGSVVVSGDTRVCVEVEDLCRGADLVIHEACRQSALADLVAGTAFETIFSYHADTVALGAMAERVEVPHMVLTHLIPAPEDEAAEREFAADLRQGGYLGRVTVGRDLMAFSLGKQTDNG
jgi:ribonuclease Z